MKVDRVHESFHKKTSVQSKIISDNNFTYKLILSVLNKWVTQFENLSVLDIGCGAGTLSFYLANKGAQVYGIDVSANAIEKCKKSAEELDLSANTTFKKMKFPDSVPRSRFDLILLIEVIEHLKEDKLALKKITSLLNKNGILILSTPSNNAPLYRLGYAREFDKKVGHLRRYDPTGLQNLLESNGFQIIDFMKTEGILRNFLYMNPYAGKFVRFIKFYLVNIVTFVDKLTALLFGESDLFVVAVKEDRK